MEQKSQKNKALPILSGVTLVAIVLIIVGFSNKTEERPAMATDVLCGNFKDLSDYVMSTIKAPDKQNDIQMNPYVITSFRWKKSQGELFVTYPVIQGIEAEYGGVTPRSNEFITSTVRENSNLIDKTIDSKIKQFGFSVNVPSSLPLYSFLDGDAIRTWAFEKGESVYTVVLQASAGHQAPGQASVAVTCGKILPQYDSVYSQLKIKSDPKIENPYNDYVQIAAVSWDKKVYGLLGSSIKIAEYYYLDNGVLQLISKDSYPTQCAPLESKKVGKGMRCVNSQYKQQTVSY